MKKQSSLTQSFAQEQLRWLKFCDLLNVSRQSNVQDKYFMYRLPFYIGTYIVGNF